MNHVDSDDLEEGEIIDDSPPFPNFNDNKRKELPQRYVVGDNKNSIGHKHKKNCRHAIRYHAKKLSKLKKTPPKIKDISKRHKPSCIYEKSHKVPNRCNSSDTIKNQKAHSKNGYFSQNSLIAEMKGSLKKVASPFNKVSTNIDKPKIEIIPIPNQNLKTCENNSATLKTSSAKTHKDKNSKPNNVYLIDLTVTPSSVTSIELKPDSNIQLIDLSNSPNDEELNITELNSNDNVKNVDTIISNNILQDKDEESEDEEELRRIALATFVKRKALGESQTIGFPCNETVSDAKHDDKVHSCHQETKNPTSDNYEVVDMEVDDDMPDSLENENAQISINQTSESSESLFVIDTNPSNDFLQNKENSILTPQTTCNSSDEEFEVNILRAELINSMYRKQLKKDNSEKLNVPIHEKQITVIQPKKPLVNYQAQNLFRNKRLKSAKHFLRKRSVSKLGSIKKNNSVIPLPVLPVQAKKTSEFIIRINDESSDDSDDNSEQETNAVSENPEESIVALISDCRQKSASNVETKEEEIVPQAVSYLSKAMQEEYNSYMKILAKKKNSPTATQTSSPKNGLVRTPLDDLKKLEEKLKVIRDALENKKKSMSAVSEEVNSKKHIYMKAKLTAQHLKEQLIAAEKARKAKLLEWSKTCDKLKLMKKSVSDLENKMNEVQNLCSKIGSSLQGQSYKLPVQNEKS